MPKKNPNIGLNKYYSLINYKPFNKLTYYINIVK